MLFDDRTISVLAYNLETILAEKLETVLSRNIANTRPRDYYDIYILYALRGAECTRQHCGGHWNGQRKNAAVLKS